MERIKHVGPAHFGLQAPPSSFLPLKVPEARPGNEKDCVTGGAGRSTLGHTGDTHHEEGEPCGVRAHTVLPSVTDSGCTGPHGSPLQPVLLPHQSDARGPHTPPSGGHPSSLSRNFSMKPALTPPPQAKLMDTPLA